MQQTKKFTERELQKVFKLKDTFFEDVNKVSFFPFQKKISNKIINSVLLNKGETFALKVSRQAGKTRSISEAVCSFLLLFYFSIVRKYGLAHKPFFNIGIFAPREEQSKTDFVYIKEMLLKVQDMGFDYTLESFSSERITLKSSMFPVMNVYCFSAGPTSYIESKTINLIILEEAQDMDEEKIKKAILPMGTDTNATVVYIGVGGYKKSLFIEMQNKLDPDNVMIYPYKEVEKERRYYYELTKDETYLNYEKYIQQQKRLYGEDSDYFKTQYELIDILERGQFITLADLMKLEHAYDPPYFYGKVHIVYGGIDWGKKNDSTVFTIIDEECKILAWFEFIGDDYSSQIEGITQIIQTRYPGMKEINCDASVTQDQIVDIFRARLIKEGMHIKINPINMGTMHDYMWKNLARLMMDKILDGRIIEPAMLKFPKIQSKEKDKFIYQMSNLQKEIKNEKWKCLAPEGPAYHDDYSVSISLACLSFRPKAKGVFAVAGMRRKT